MDLKELEKAIDLYGMDVNDFEVSPFETVDMLHRRSEIEQHYNQLTPNLEEKLRQYDQTLLQNVKKMYDHLSGAHDWKLNKHTTHWWWHLDRIINDKLVVDLVNRTVVEKEERTMYIEDTKMHFADPEALDAFLDLVQSKRIVLPKKEPPETYKKAE